jgi:hypothetical protein
MRVFIGYDSREAVAWHVLAHSIMRRASRPVSLHPLVLSELRGIGYTRPKADSESTEFSISRFLVPLLSDFEGVSVFMDCDMLCLADVHELVDGLVIEDDVALWVAKHDYVPKYETKFLGNKQVSYPKKNWSSLMVFNNAACRKLTRHYVENAPASELHQFKWLKPGQRIGELPLEWNWLVGEYDPNWNAKMLHFTLGGPWFEEYEGCDHAGAWRTERDHMLGG